MPNEWILLTTIVGWVVLLVQQDQVVKNQRKISENVKRLSVQLPKHVERLEKIGKWNDDVMSIVARLKSIADLKRERVTNLKTQGVKNMYLEYLSKSYDEYSKEWVQIQQEYGSVQRCAMASDKTLDIKNNDLLDKLQIVRNLFIEIFPKLIEKNLEVEEFLQPTEYIDVITKENFGELVIACKHLDIELVKRELDIFGESEVEPHKL